MTRVLVGLGLSAGDDTTLAIAAAVCERMGATSIRFLHVVPEVDLADSVIRRFPGLQDGSEDVDESRLRNYVEARFPAPADRLLEYLVLEGNRATELVRRAREEEADLLIVGRRTDRPSITSERAIRKAPCSVLMVPRDSEETLARILVPLDFSPNSVDALKRAVALASRASTSSAVTCYHAYSVPLGYQKTGKTREEFAEIMRENAERQLQNTVHQLDLHDLQLERRFDLFARTSDGIIQAASDSHSDLIVMGARGRTPGAGLLIGSVTERVIRRARIPVLVVKQQQPAQSLFDALFEM